MTTPSAEFQRWHELQLKVEMFHFYGGDKKSDAFDLLVGECHEAARVVMLQDAVNWSDVAEKARVNARSFWNCDISWLPVEQYSVSGEFEKLLLKAIIGLANKEGLAKPTLFP